MKIKLAAVLTALGMCAAHADPVALPAGVTQPAFFATHDVKVVGYQRGPGGLNVWSVERNNTRTVLYTTADNKVLLSGVLWDARSGTNLSDAFITPDMTSQETGAPVAAPEQTAAAPAASAPLRGAPGKISPPIAGVAALKGIKEGSAPVAKTIYILFDPRCPHCKNVFSATRDFVRSGGSIKWIPTTVLGHDAQGTAMVADIMQDRSPIDAFGRVENGGFRQPAVINKSTLDMISDNEQYFWAAFDRNKGAGTPGVPVAFFQDKDGSPQMVGDLDDPVLLGRILKDMK
ncbi:hypothetical protein R70006_05010 [Paraburkholderia domus]|uniref:DsbC family protein n=1 Tax=Paraburkholderia domus TaxID=2793075 RepID=UPI001911B0C3|nr:DsbC family protein [Paraburkholderia domus]MBK5051754.1 DsbC family protein [Burkholderia sp. R-70006]CAE6794577.1 hypothetical protein R70006_05010 [Paraburkholderia domus]